MQRTQLVKAHDSSEKKPMSNHSDSCKCCSRGGHCLGHDRSSAWHACKHTGGASDASVWV
eukprot:4727819-Amphidinium_carterae.1